LCTCRLGPKICEGHASSTSVLGTLSVCTHACNHRDPTNPLLPSLFLCHTPCCPPSSCLSHPLLPSLFLRLSHPLLLTPPSSSSSVCRRWLGLCGRCAQVEQSSHASKSWTAFACVRAALAVNDPSQQVCVLVFVAFLCVVHMCFRQALLAVDFWH
jgi:hypothetical protein